MARYVKISTIGIPSITVDESLSFEEVNKQIETYLSNQIEQVLPDRPDLILLPEMCDIPANYDSSRRSEYVNYRGESYLHFYGKIAKENNCNLAFCTYRYGKGDYLLNTLFIIDRKGKVAGHYNKNHIVIPDERNQNVLGGNEAPIINLDIGKVAGAICFDLNFDILRSHYKKLRPEIILFPSMYHGGLKQQFWAQNCQAYFVGAISHSRPSSIISPLGEILAYTTNISNFVTKTINLDYSLIHWDHHHEKLAALKQKYGPDVTIFDPGNIGYVMITSENVDVSATDMIEEFKMKTYEDYIREALEAHNMPENRGIGGVGE